MVTNICRLLILSLVLVAQVSFVGCGSGGNDTVQPPPVEPSTGPPGPEPPSTDEK
jgi:hypothetical protein